MLMSALVFKISPADTTMKVIVFLVSYFAFHCEGVSQDWGYVTVRPNAHMFWWLYYSPESLTTKGGCERPLIIWLQGGPGESSTGVGNFLLIGPQDVESQARNYTWVNDYNVLFIDSPVGAGFSYVDNRFAFSASNGEIAEDLLTCVTEFFKIRWEFIHAPIYIVGESYGGKIAIEFANMWYKRQMEQQIDSHLRGVLLGNPWIAPDKIIESYGSHLMNLGVIDRNGHDIVSKIGKEIASFTSNNRYLDATNSWIKMKRRILNLTNNIDFYNVLHMMHPYDYQSNQDYETMQQLYLHMNGPIKRKLDINCTIWGSQKGDVRFFLFEDLMKSVYTQVEHALKNTTLKIYIYNGQLDATVDISGTTNWIEQLKWPDKDKWEQSERKALIINGIIEGYFKKYGRFALYWINRSGHMVQKDNPFAGLQVVKDITNNH